MRKKCIKKISLWLFNNKVISNESRAYYEYGIELVLNDILIFFSIGSIAVITNTVITSLFFSFSFCVLRSFAGGYHCKTYVNCFCLTLINYLLMLFLNFILSGYKLFICLILTVISVPILVFESMQQDKKYNKIRMSLLCVLTISIISSALLFSIEISFAISWAIFTVLLLLCPAMLFSKIKSEGRQNIIKSQILKLVATVADQFVKKANNTASTFWTYQPKAPDENNIEHDDSPKQSPS